MEYKVVETSMVTDEEIEKILNNWTAHGYLFESVHFVTTESSRRPKMAFVFFTKKGGKYRVGTKGGENEELRYER
jgi:hypothetical protein